MVAQSIADVSVALPSWHGILAVLTLQAGYNSAVVVLGAAALGLAGGLIGTFSLLRKRALVSDALAHSALPGLAVAFLISVYLLQGTRSLSVLLLGAAISGVFGVFCIQWISKATRLREDTAIGAVLSVFFGIGIVLLSVIQSLGTGQEGGLHHFIYGQTAALSMSDAQLTAMVAALVALLSMLLLKEFRLICFDPEFAVAQGWSVNAIDALMMSAVVLVTVVGLQTVGMLLIVALLIIPAAAARFWSERLSRMTIISGVFGAASGYLGAVASSLLPRLPAGAVIVLVAGLLFLFSFLFAPNRGLFASTMRRLGLTVRIAEDHFLRELFEYIESANSLSDPHISVHLQDLRVVGTWGSLWRRMILALLSWRSLINRRDSGQAVKLTEEGLQVARRLTRNHRLWEEYIITVGHVATSHVDYSADLVEHVLSAEIVDELEEALQQKGTLPFSPSVHPL